MTEQQEKFLEILERSLGIVSVALQQLQISRDDFDSWMTNQTFKRRYQQVQELSVDYVENKLLGLINGGDLSAIQFYLKTKGKKRGY
jgi:hypothetical protein